MALSQVESAVGKSPGFGVLQTSGFESSFRDWPHDLGRVHYSLRISTLLTREPRVAVALPDGRRH